MSEITTKIRTALDESDGSVLLIHHGQLHKNIEQVRSVIGNRFFWAVVKANAYGLGDVEIAQSIEAKIDGFAVARLHEANRLLEAGITKPILLLGPLPSLLPDNPQIHITISCPADLERVLQESTACPLHIKIDTGMGRLGLNKNLEWLEQALQLGDRWVGLWSHYSHADALNHPKTIQQKLDFVECVDQVQAKHKLEHIHISNSGGLLNLSSVDTGVRVGLYLYGVSPWDQVQEKIPLAQPVVEWVTRVTNLRKVEAGVGVSYLSQYTTPQPCTLGVIPVGYADGLATHTATRMYVVNGDQKFPVRGRITMDLTIVEVPDPSAAVTQNLTYVIGPIDHTKGNSVSQLATVLQRIPYEVLTNFGPRIQRIHMT